MRRREVIGLIGGSAALPLFGARRAYAQSSMVRIGYLHSGSAGPNARFINAFKSGLAAGGFSEGRKLSIEFRFADGKPNRLPTLAEELVRTGVSVIATGGAELPIFAAKTATERSNIPVVFVVGGDPVKLGIVPSLARPGGHLTGVSMFTSALENKRFGLLHEVVPSSKVFAALVDPGRAVVGMQIAEVTDATRQAGVRLVVVRAANESEFAAAFSTAASQEAGGLQICASPNFLPKRQQLVDLAARYRIPTIYEWRDFAEAGGLMSYGTDLADAYRQAGSYVAKILGGIQPSDLPVIQSAKFEFVINLKTARELGFEFARTVLARADEVIE